jgi:hypothetical protein
LRCKIENPTYTKLSELWEAKTRCQTVS